MTVALLGVCVWSKSLASHMLRRNHQLQPFLPSLPFLLWVNPVAGSQIAMATLCPGLQDIMQSRLGCRPHWPISARDTCACPYWGQPLESLIIYSVLSEPSLNPKLAPQASENQWTRVSHESWWNSKELDQHCSAKTAFSSHVLKETDEHCIY